MDIYVVITGRRGSGKDTVADIGIRLFNCSGKVALADWFKETLAKEFRLPLAKFYDTEAKDAKFSKPIVLTRGNLRNLTMKLGEYGYNNVNRISTSKWDGRQINSIRELMLWFGHDVVTKICGDTFHCKVTEERKIKAIPRKNGQANVIFITDARKHEQSVYFLNKYKNVFPVLVKRPDGSNDDHFVEKSVDEFPDDYFFTTIVNDGSVENLEEKVRELMVKIRETLKDAGITPGGDAPSKSQMKRLRVQKATTKSIQS